MPQRLQRLTIGIIGVGRIGSRVLRRIAAFGTPRVLANDINPNTKLVPELIAWLEERGIFRNQELALSDGLTKNRLLQQLETVLEAPG